VKIQIRIKECIRASRLTSRRCAGYAVIGVCDSGHQEQLRARHGRSDQIRHHRGPVSPWGHRRLPPLIGARRLRSLGKSPEPLRAPSCRICRRGRCHTKERTLEPPPVGGVAVLTLQSPPLGNWREAARRQCAQPWASVLVGERACGWGRRRSPLCSARFLSLSLSCASIEKWGNGG
jgi:hypothetical protein